MRFTWLSNSPWTPSGYGQQTRMFMPRLTKLGHEGAVICSFGLDGGAIIFDGYMCMPKRLDAYGHDVFVPHSQAFGAQVCFSLLDTWVMHPEQYPLMFKWIPWFPIDHDPLPMFIRGKLAQAYRRITFSKYALAEVHKAGLDCMYVPHGIETSIFHPGDKKAAREKLGLPLDKWIVGTVAMNKGAPSRKNFDEMLRAFAAFHAKHTDTMYVLQTETGDQAPEMVNLPELVGLLGLKLGEDVVFPNQYQNVFGFPSDHIATVYRALDCHMLVSAGEGFGIPILESQACGIPGIVGDWTACSELCFGGHLIDKADAWKQYTSLASYQYRPDPRAIEIALNLEYKSPTPMTRAIEQAAEYDADRVTETYWKPALAEIEASL